MNKRQPTITLVFDGSKDNQRTNNTILALQKNEQICCEQIIFISPPRLASVLHPNTSIQTVVSATDCLELLSTIQTDLIGYVPRDVVPSTLLPDITSIQSNFIAPWAPDAVLPKETATEIAVDVLPWIASTSIVKSVLPKVSPNKWTVLDIARLLEKDGTPFKWVAAQASRPHPLPPSVKGEGRKRQSSSTSPCPLTFPSSKLDVLKLSEKYSPVPLTFNSTVLAVVPHYRCEAWLHRCLDSLVSQTRLPDEIVVVHDGDSPPIALVQNFPSITLLASPCNVGPYRLIQQVIDDTDYDAYLFQDADDWSACDRLSKLLHAAALSGAELLGTQEFRVFEERSQLTPVCYPRDVNAALAEKPGHPLLHPTSLVARNLVQRLGGFATGLRFGGDTEFLLRAAIAAKIVNVPDYCYFRRKRVGSLTTAPDTGLDSPARAELLRMLKSRALANHTAIRAGRQPCLSPLVKAAPIKLSYVTGPELRWVTQPGEN